MRNETIKHGTFNTSQQRRRAQLLAGVQLVADRIPAVVKVRDRSNRVLIATEQPIYDICYADSGSGSLG